MPNEVENTPRVMHPENASTFEQFLLFRRHYFAYECAVQHAARYGCFLDVACGFGSALDIISGHFEKVIAVDAAASALQALPAKPNIEARIEDAASLSLQDDSVDTVAAFQLIEHVETEQALQIVKEMFRVLKPGGRGFITSPNARWRLLEGQRPWNRYHVHEYQPAEILEFCRKLGIPEKCIYGIIGRNGAQELEIARVKQNLLAVKGGRPGKFAERIIKKLSPKARKARKEASRPPTQEDFNRSWFTLSRKYTDGLDFWIEITK